MTITQVDTIEFLSRVLTSAGQAVSKITTHISIVLMAGDRVFKLKRVVKLPYVDFSTPELRLFACEAEYELNRRTAPALYVGAHRVTREPDGSPSLDGDGTLIDAVVEMRRFDQRDLFDCMAIEGGLTVELTTRLAHHIAHFHKSLVAETSPDGRRAMSYALDINTHALKACVQFAPGRVRRLIDRFDEEYLRLGPILDARSASGAIRRCHGDLHLRNICLFEGAPTLFDCIEFNARLATIDVLYDLAFLLMDLWHRDMKEVANLVFNRYLDETRDVGSLAVVPLFMAIRAAVRAHVSAVQAEQEPREPLLAQAAQNYFDLAEDLLIGKPLRLLVIGGLSGSGKSTLAAAIAPSIGAAPGARVLSTDRIRKRLFAVPVEERLPATAYRPNASSAVYEAQRREASQVLKGSHSVVADGVFLSSEERIGIEAAGAGTSARFSGLWLGAPLQTLVARIEQRTGDPSDATADVVALQLKHAPCNIDWRRIDAGGMIVDTVEAARRAMASDDS